MTIFYNNQRKPRTIGGVTASGSDPNSVQWNGSANQGQLNNSPDAVGGRSWQAGVSNPNGGMFSNGTTYDMLGTGQWGTGESFQGAARVAALKSIRDAQSTANPEDYAAMNEMRDYYRNYLGNLSGMSADQRSLVDTQSQFGVKNNLQQLKNANAGRGTMGSRQYGGMQGDIMSRSNSDLINGLIKARADEIQQANATNQGLGNLQNRDLIERNFQLDQGKAMANQINTQQGYDTARQGGLESAGAQREADDKGMIGNLIGAYMSMLGYGAASGAVSKG